MDFKDYFETFFASKNAWSSITHVSIDENKIICQKFGFKFFYFTGKFSNTEQIYGWSHLYCERNVSDIDDCKVGKTKELLSYLKFN